MRYSWCVLLLCSVLLPARAATAQERDGEARALYQAGVSAYGAGRYEDAQQYFRQAYDLSGRPQLLFNLGQSADRARNDDAAIDAFERYLAEVPDAPNRTAVEARLVALRRAQGATQERLEVARREAQAEAEAERLAAAEAERLAAIEAEEAAAAEAAAAAQGERFTQASPREPEETSRSRVGLIVGIVVAVVAAGAGAAIIATRDRSPNYASGNTGTTVAAVRW